MSESLPQVIGHINEGLQMLLHEARLRRKMRECEFVRNAPTSTYQRSHKSIRGIQLRNRHVGTVISRGEWRLRYLTLALGPGRAGGRGRWRWCRL